MVCHVFPLLRAGGADGIKGVIIRPDVNRAVRRDGGRGANPFAGREGPFLEPVRRERVELSVVGADINGSVRSHRGRSPDRAAGRESPLLLAVSVQRVEVPVKAAEVEGAVRRDRRRGKNPVGRLKFPEHVARRQPDRRQHTVGRWRVEYAVRTDGRGTDHRLRGRQVPDLRTVRTQREQAVVQGAETDCAVRPDRCGT